MTSIQFEYVLFEVRVRIHALTPPNKCSTILPPFQHISLVLNVCICACVSAILLVLLFVFRFYSFIWLSAVLLAFISWHVRVHACNMEVRVVYHVSVHCIKFTYRIWAFCQLLQTKMHTQPTHDCVWFHFKNIHMNSLRFFVRLQLWFISVLILCTHTILFSCVLTFESPYFSIALDIFKSFRKN